MIIKKLAQGEGREIKTNTKPEQVELTAEQSEPRTVLKKKEIPKEKFVEPVELRRSTRERKAPKRHE